jgi:methylene-fatty-acyl-phospholipid synthase
VTILLPLLAAAVALSIERIAYAWTWHRPAAFRALARRAGVAEPVDLLVRLFYVFKLVQVAVFAGWCLWFGSRTGWPTTVASVPGLAGIVLIAAGQALNTSVFLRLGRIGVFYGNRLGHRVPWCEGFPFSVVRHPQYVGTTLTIWGVFLLLRFPHADWALLPALETLYYAIGATLERTPAEADWPSLADNSGTCCQVSESGGLS